MKKLTILMVFLGLMISMVIFCSASAKSVITVGHDDPPTLDCSTHLWALTFKNLVEARTNGEIEIKIYSSGTAGGQRAMSEMLQEGTLDISFASPGGVQPFMPEMGAIEHPFLFPSEIVAKEAVMKGYFLDYCRNIFDERMGVYLFSFISMGFYQLTNNVRPIKNLEDLKGIKLRVMDSPAQICFWASLGARPTPIAWGEVYTSLQMGVIDGQTNPLPTMAVKKLEEVQDYCTLTNHMFAFDFVLLNKDLLNKLSKENRIIVEQSLADAAEVYYGFVRKKDAVELMIYLKEEKGMKFTSLSFEERERWKVISQKAMLEFYENEYGDKAIELLKELEIAINNVLEEHGWE